MFFRTGSTGFITFFCRISTHHSDRLHDFSVTIPRCYKDVYANSFFPRTARLWNSLPFTECFLLTYILNGFKSRINRHLLIAGSLQRDFLRALIFRASVSCNSMPCSGCSALHGVNPNFKKTMVKKYTMVFVAEIHSWLHIVTVQMLTMHGQVLLTGLLQLKLN